jgi:hypothetical protein
MKKSRLSFFAACLFSLAAHAADVPEANSVSIEQAKAVAESLNSGSDQAFAAKVSQQINSKNHAKLSDPIDKNDPPVLRMLKLNDAMDRQAILEGQDLMNKPPLVSSLPKTSGQQEAVELRITQICTDQECDTVTFNKSFSTTTVNNSEIHLSEAKDSNDRTGTHLFLSPHLGANQILLRLSFENKMRIFPVGSPSYDMYASEIRQVVPLNLGKDMIFKPVYIETKHYKIKVEAAIH